MWTDLSKQEISGTLCFRIPFLLRRNYTELLSNYQTFSPMLLRGKNDRNLKKHAERKCYTMCIKCKFLNMHAGGTQRNYWRVMYFCVVLYHILYCNNWLRSTTQSQQPIIQRRWHKVTCAEVKCCLTVHIPDIQRIQNYSVAYWFVFCEFYLKIEMFSVMTFWMVQLCPFSTRTQISHTRTHTLCFLLVPLDHEDQDTRIFRNTRPKTRHIPKSRILSKEIYWWVI